MPLTDEIVSRAVKKCGAKRENLLPVLQCISYKEGYLSEEVMVKIAEIMEISAADVYGVATFYSFLNTKPRGKNVIRVCKTIACYMHSRNSIIQAIEEKLRVKLGETTPDNKFTLLRTNCIGQCHEGPAMLINDDVYTNLTPETVIAAIEKYI